MNPLFVKARSRLILDNPFFGTLCLRQKPTEWDEPTGAVDGKHLFYNVKWFEKLTEMERVGFLAHEVSSIVPEAVSGEKDAMADPILYEDGDELPSGKKVGDVKKDSAPEYQGIDHSKLVPLLVKTVQELEARIKTLEG